MSKNNDMLISEGKLKQLKEDQIRMVEAYAIFADTDKTILPFLKVLNKKLLSTIKEIENKNINS